MKTTTTRLTIAAAVLAVATGAASAQAMNAEIPFAFRAGNAVLPAGTYRVDVQATKQWVTLSTFESQRSVMLLPSGGTDVPRAWKDKGGAALAFACGPTRCELVRI